MLIVKELDSSNKYFTDESHILYLYPYVKWGLGDDGRIYYKAHMEGADYGMLWLEPFFTIPLVEMKKIVKEFAHLLPFL